LCLPLLAEGRLLGLLLAAHPQADFFLGARAAIAETAARTVAALYAQSRRSQDLARERSRLTEIQDEWRKRLSRDLHDGPTQAIAAIAMQLNYAGRLMERNPAAARDELRKSEELARRTAVCNAPSHCAAARVRGLVAASPGGERRSAASRSGREGRPMWRASIQMSRRHLLPGGRAIRNACKHQAETPFCSAAGPGSCSSRSKMTVWVSMSEQSTPITPSAAASEWSRCASAPS
jgi:hypothetical protein